MKDINVHRQKKINAFKGSIKDFAGKIVKSIF